MHYVAEYLAPLLDIDASTITLLLIMIGFAGKAVRQEVTSVFTLLLLGPLAMGASLVSYSVMVALNVFDPKNMGEWLMYTTCAGTAGALIVLGAAALVMSKLDREDARIRQAAA